MIKQNKLKIIVSSAITLLPVIIGLALWNRLPANIATSFDLSGAVTGYSSKEFAVIGFPLILTLVNLICIIATSTDPRKKNIDSKAFSVVISIVPACSLICSACIYGNALGYKVSPENIMPVFTGVIILAIGFVLPRCKQNYTLGIRLPWTLHDEKNWDKTHKFTGKLWIICGIVMTISGLFNFMILYMIIVFAIAIIPPVYSYLLYKNGDV